MGYIASELLERLNRQSKELDNIYHGVAARLGLSENTFWVLYILSDTERQYSQQDICKEWSFSKQTVNSTICGLIEKGYVYMERAPDSKRRKIVKLTNEGSAFVRNNVLRMRNVEEKALAHMTGKEQETYVDLSEKYAVYLREEAELYMQSMNKKLKSYSI